MDNPFENPVPDVKEKEIEKNIKALAEQSAKLLKNPEYEKYKNMFYEAQKRCMVFLYECPETDAQKFAVEAKCLLAKLDYAGMVIREIEKDATVVKRRAKK